MKCIFRLSIAAVLVAAALGCGPRIMVPPKIDLTQHEVISIIELKSSNEGELGPLAIKKFMEAIRRDQEMVRIIELGTESEVLNAVNSDKLDQTTYMALGEKHKVITIFTGELIVSDVRPDITIAPLFGHMDFTAEVDAMLNAQMVETATGASIWSGSASATKKIGEVSIFGGKYFVFDAENPDRAYGKLVDELVEKVTKDFRVTWKRE